MNVKFVDLSYQNDRVQAEVDSQFAEIMASSAFIGGRHVAEFEHNFSNYIGTRHAIGMANGTDALHLALRACGLGPGDEVITAANTFIATTEAISAAGASIVLVDMDPESYTIDVSRIEEVITSKTKAIMPVHLYGQPADMATIMEIAGRHNLRVIEDASQAHGAMYGGWRVGSIGDIGCFSCYPGKNLGAFGDAGVVVTNDDFLADRLRLLANHGSRTKYHHEIEGWNSRLDTLQAAVLNAKLPHLDRWNEERRDVAALYETLLEGTNVHTPRIVNEDHVWHLYVVEVESRDGVVAMLAEEGVTASVHYPNPLHLLPAYRHLGLREGLFPATERAARRIVSLPMYPGLEPAQIEHVADVLRRATSLATDGARAAD